MLTRQGCLDEVSRNAFHPVLPARRRTFRRSLRKEESRKPVFRSHTADQLFKASEGRRPSEQARTTRQEQSTGSPRTRQPLPTERASNVELRMMERVCGKEGDKFSRVCRQCRLDDAKRKMPHQHWSRKHQTRWEIMLLFFRKWTMDM